MKHMISAKWKGILGEFEKELLTQHHLFDYLEASLIRLQFILQTQFVITSE